MQARLAQSVEHGTLNPRVVGSSPTLGAFFSLHSPFHCSVFLFQCTQDAQVVAVHETPGYQPPVEAPPTCWDTFKVCVVSAMSSIGWPTPSLLGVPSYFRAPAIVVQSVN